MLSAQNLNLNFSLPGNVCILSLYRYQDLGVHFGVEQHSSTCLLERFFHFPMNPELQQLMYPTETFLNFHQKGIFFYDGVIFQSSTLGKFCVHFNAMLLHKNFFAHAFFCNFVLNGLISLAFSSYSIHSVYSTPCFTCKCIIAPLIRGVLRKVEVEICG